MNWAAHMEKFLGFRLHLLHEGMINLLSTIGSSLYNSQSTPNSSGHLPSWSLLGDHRAIRWWIRVDHQTWPECGPITPDLDWAGSRFRVSGRYANNAETMDNRELWKMMVHKLAWPIRCWMVPKQIIGQTWISRMYGYESDWKFWTAAG